ncbi:palI [Fusarium beomiforme]|uniref:PalI n=1 Tax=Fusarium beomiforme TaxID=44412 RepID=A0A9P5AV97_9HYPO|nr:palI [Fusarium beomiforme]
MGLGRFIHHIGAFFLLAATVMLVVVSITAPVVNDIALLKVDFNGNFRGGNGVNFGTFGYCVTRSSGGDSCTSARIGYDPSNAVDGANFSNVASDTAKALTYVMVLHPIGAGLCFIAFLLALGAGIFGSLMSTLVSLLAFLVTIVALACDFAGFSIIRRRINRDTSASARWSVGIWLVLVAAILCLIGTIAVFVTCCSGRRRRSRENKKMAAYNTSPTRY